MNDIDSYKKFFNATTIAMMIVRTVSNAMTGSFFISEYEALAKIGSKEASKENPSTELLKAIEDRMIDMANEAAQRRPAGGIPFNGPEELFKPGQRFKDGGLMISDPMPPTQFRS